MNDYAALLRKRALEAVSLGQHETARLLRGFAETIAKDPSAVARIRSRVRDQAGPVDGDGSPAWQIWNAALGDLSPTPVRPKAPPATSQAPQRKQRSVSAEMEPPRSDIDLRELRKAAARFNTVMDRMDRVMETVRSLRDRVERLEAANGRLEKTNRLSGTVAERMRAQPLHGGRSWLDLVVEIAEEHVVRPGDMLSRDRCALVSAARAHVWWSLHNQHGVPLSRIGKLWDRDHTTVLSGVRGHEERLRKRVLTRPEAPANDAAA